MPLSLNTNAISMIIFLQPIYHLRQELFFRLLFHWVKSPKLKPILIFVNQTLLAFIAKYGIPTNQWTWLYEALLEVSMTKIAQLICVYVDDWTAESAVKASNELFIFHLCTDIYIYHKNIILKFCAL